MKIIKWLIKSILAGIFIGIGCIAFLSSENKVVGSILFTIGLFSILVLRLNLFTGKVCYVIEQKNYLEVFITLLGNFVGTFIIAVMMRFSRLQTFLDKANNIVNIKLSDSLLSLFILAILCNVLIYLAVEFFSKENNIKGVLALFFGVTIFVLCGFEHCVADMVYFNFALSYSFDTFLRLFIIVIGNVIGGIGIRNITKKLEDDKTPNRK